MISLILSILVSAALLLLGAYLLKGVTLDGFSSAILVAVVIALMSGLVGWLFGGLAKYGIIQLALNTVFIQVADHFLDGFSVKGWLDAFLLALIVAVFSSVIYWIF